MKKINNPEKLPVPGKVKKGFRRYAAAVLSAAVMMGMAMPAFAAGDPLGVVNNLTSIISKEEKIVLRSISIDSHDGLFSGTLTVMLDDTSRLQQLIKKLKTVKGIKNVSRS